MKKPYPILSALVLIAMFFYFSQCKKSASAKPINTDSSNITLHDKSLSVIQSHIKGNWKLQYEKGGFVAAYIYHPTDSTFNLYSTLSPARIIFKNALSVTVDTTITWIHLNFSGDSTYAMTFHDFGGVPYTLGAYSVINDTLVLYELGPDGIFFYYTKSNQ